MRESRDESNVNRIMKNYYIYILASKKNGTLYIGVTGDLIKRVDEHKQNTVAGFTKKYNVHTLVYYEVFQDIEEAILREKQMKKWNRSWKINLIEEKNPEWKDLYSEII
jgi:putative endonuclease